MFANIALCQFVAKLERRGPLPAKARDALLALQGTQRDYAANQTIVAAGDLTTHCVLVESGLVSRVKHMEIGSRQIVAFHVPGDAVDLQSVLFARSDHEIRSHTPSRTCWIAHNDILELTASYPVVANALWLDTLVDSAIFREWTANIGQRNARARIAHLFLEMAARLQAIHLVKNDTYEFPVTQVNLAESLGLSLVHLNKSLQALRKAGYVTFKDRRVFMTNRDALLALSNFRDDYLHLNAERIKDPAVVTANALAS